MRLFIPIPIPTPIGLPTSDSVISSWLATITLSIQSYLFSMSHLLMPYHLYPYQCPASPCLSHHHLISIEERTAVVIAAAVPRCGSPRHAGGRQVASALGHVDPDKGRLRHQNRNNRLIRAFNTLSHNTGMGTELRWG